MTLKKVMFWVKRLPVIFHFECKHINKKIKNKNKNNILGSLGLERYIASV